MLAVTSNRRSQRTDVRRRATRCNIPEDGILHSERCETSNLTYQIIMLLLLMSNGALTEEDNVSILRRDVWSESEIACGFGNHVLDVLAFSARSEVILILKYLTFYQYL
jgi:hypothetical protein